MKLNFLSLCFSALILLASCTKEYVTPPSGSNQNDYPAPVIVTASDWTSESSMTWSDATATSSVFTTTNWDAPELTQEMVDNGAVLIYANTTSGDAPKLLPAMFERTSNSEYDEYRSVAEPRVIQLSHATYKDGDYATPIVNDDVSFRYILINNAPPANGRIITNNGVEYNLDELKLMSYSEVITILGIAQ